MRIIFGVGIGFDANSQPIPATMAEGLIERAIHATTVRWGGCFVTRGEGAWRNPRGGIVREPGIAITVDVEAVEESAITTHAKFLKALFSQEMIAVTVLYAEPSFV